MYTKVIQALTKFIRFSTAATAALLMVWSGTPVQAVSFDEGLYYNNDIIFYDPDNCVEPGEGSVGSYDGTSTAGLSDLQAEFVDKYHDIAESLSIKYGIPWETVMAQGILESAAGTSNFAVNRNNFFGIGAFDSNPNNAFSYATPEEGWEGYYKNIVATSVYRANGAFNYPDDPYAYAQAIKNAGYASDPNYVSKLSVLIDAIIRRAEEKGWETSAELVKSHPEMVENAEKNARGEGGDVELEGSSALDECCETISDIEWEDGWIVSGMPGYVKESAIDADAAGTFDLEDDAYKSEYSTDGKPNKILLHNTEGTNGSGDSGLALYGGGFLPRRRGERIQSHGTAAEFACYGFEHRLVHDVESEFVHVEMFESLARDSERDRVQPLHLREIAHTAQQSVRHARSAAAAPRDLFRRVRVNAHAENAGGPPYYLCQLGRRVHLQPHQHAEPVAERAGQHPRPRRRADERELLERYAYAARHGTLAGYDVQRVVLHCGIQHFFYAAVEAVYLVDEKYVALFEIGENGGKIRRPFYRRTGRHSYLRAELVGDDVRERGLAESRRAVQQDVVKSLSPRLSRGNEYAEVELDLVLPDIVRHTLRAESHLGFVVFQRQTADNSFVVHNHRIAVSTAYFDGINRRCCKIMLYPMNLSAVAMRSDTPLAVSFAFCTARTASVLDTPSDTSAKTASDTSASMLPPISVDASAISTATCSRRLSTMSSAVFLPSPFILDSVLMSPVAMATVSVPRS